MSPKLQGGRDHLDSAASSAAAPGSVGWQAPELLLVSLLLREERSPHDPLLQGSPGGDSGGGGGGEDWADGAGSQGGSPGGPQVRSSPEAPVPAAACDGGQQGGSDQGGGPVSSGAPSSQSPVDPRWRLTRAADVWSLGCVLFHVLDPGGHPFGETYEVRGGGRDVPGKEEGRAGSHCLCLLQAACPY